MGELEEIDREQEIAGRQVRPQLPAQLSDAAVFPRDLGAGQALGGVAHAGLGPLGHVVAGLIEAVGGEARQILHVEGLLILHAEGLQRVRQLVLHPAAGVHRQVPEIHGDVPPHQVVFRVGDDIVPAAAGGAVFPVEFQAAADAAAEDPEGQVDAGHLLHAALAEEVFGQQLLALVELLHQAGQLLGGDPEGDQPVGPEVAGDLFRQYDVVAAVGAGQGHFLGRGDDLRAAGHAVVDGQPIRRRRRGMGAEGREIIAVQAVFFHLGAALRPDLKNAAAIIADQLARFRVEAQRASAGRAFLLFHRIHGNPPSYPVSTIVL